MPCTDEIHFLNSLWTKRADSKFFLLRRSLLGILEHEVSVQHLELIWAQQAVAREHQYITTFGQTKQHLRWTFCEQSYSYKILQQFLITNVQQITHIRNNTIIKLMNFCLNNNLLGEIAKYSLSTTLVKSQDVQLSDSVNEFQVIEWIC